MTRPYWYAVQAAIILALLIAFYNLGHRHALECVREGEGSDIAGSPSAVADTCEE
jgi:hypothetical protein